MKNKSILILIMITIFFTGCSRIKEDELFKKGRLALEKHDYTKAQEIFSQVLTEDSTNDNARSMYMQAVKMQDALEYEKKHMYDKAIQTLESIVKIKGGSSQIKSEATEKKKEITKLNEEYKKAQEERKENAKNVSSKESSKLEENEEDISSEEEQQTDKQQTDKQQKQEENNDENNDQKNNGLSNILDGIFGNAFDSSDETSDEEAQTPSNEDIQSEENYQP